MNEVTRQQRRDILDLIRASIDGLVAIACLADQRRNESESLNRDARAAWRTVEIAREQIKELEAELEDSQTTEVIFPNRRSTMNDEAENTISLEDCEETPEEVAERRWLYAKCAAAGAFGAGVVITLYKIIRL